MSAKELRLGGNDNGLFRIEKNDRGGFKIAIEAFMNVLSMDIDRRKAEWLKLYLEEHLAVNKFYIMCQYCKKEHDSRLTCVEYCEHDAKRSL